MWTKDPYDESETTLETVCQSCGEPFSKHYKDGGSCPRFAKDTRVTALESKFRHLKKEVIHVIDTELSGVDADTKKAKDDCEALKSRMDNLEAKLDVIVDLLKTEI